MLTSSSSIDYARLDIKIFDHDKYEVFGNEKKPNIGMIIDRLAAMEKILRWDLPGTSKILKSDPKTYFSTIRRALVDVYENLPGSSLKTKCTLTKSTRKYLLYKSKLEHFTKAQEPFLYPLELETIQKIFSFLPTRTFLNTSLISTKGYQVTKKAFLIRARLYHYNGEEPKEAILHLKKMISITKSLSIKPENITLQPDPDSLFEHLSLQTENRSELIFKAVREGDVVILREMLFDGYNPNSKVATATGEKSLLTIAVMNEHEKIVDELIKSGAEPKQLDPCWIKSIFTQDQAHFNNFPILHNLIIHDWNPNTTDDMGNTALHYACMAEDVNLLDTLLYYRANPNARNEKGDTPVSILLRYGKGSNKSANALRHLLEHGADPFKKDSAGQDVLTKVCNSKSRTSELMFAEVLSCLNDPSKRI